MSFGVYLPISHPHGLPSPRTILDYAGAAEELGFDGLWVGDHLLWRTHLLEATTTLAAVAGVTRRIALGTNVYLLGLRPPLVSANVLGTLSYLAEDRLVLGVGVGGEFPAEFEGVGVPLKQRGAQLDRALTDVRRWWGWSDGPAEAPVVTPAPGPRMRLWVGGRSEPALRRAVRERADAWSAHFVTPAQVETMGSRLAELAGEEAAPVPEVAVTLNINIADDGGREARAFAEAHFGLPFERIGRHIVSGSVEECAEQVAAYAEVCDHLIFFPASFDVTRQLTELDDVRRRVLPSWQRARRRHASPASP